MRTARAVILARGLGSRMRERGPADARDADAALTPEQRRAADAGHKASMPVHGRPFLDYLLSHLADAGVSRVAVIVAPDHRALRAHYERDAPAARLHPDFVVQPEARGTADAVVCVEQWTAGEPFLAMNADNLYPVRALRDLMALDEPGLSAFDPADLVRTSNIPVSRLAAFAVVDADAAGYVTHIVEKPRPALIAAGASGIPDGRISMNLWRFDSRIFAACRDVPRSRRGEFELPEAVGVAMARGVRFRAVPASGPVLDLSRRTDLVDVERRLAGTVPRP